MFETHDADSVAWNDETILLRHSDRPDVKFRWDELKKIVASHPPFTIILHLEDQSFAISSSVKHFHEFEARLTQLVGLNEKALNDTCLKSERTREVCWDDKPAWLDHVVPPRHRSDLILAVFLEDDTAVTDALRNGSDVNERWGDDQCTPLMLALEENESDRVVRVLLNNGADLNLQDSNGLTALHYAVIVAIENPPVRGRLSVASCRHRTFLADFENPILSTTCVNVISSGDVVK